MKPKSAWVFPGQGAQRRGMGSELFDRFPDLCATADRVLGRSVAELCVDDPDGLLRDTRYAQPAIFVVNALTYLAAVADGDGPPDYLAGHSLGEYDALFAAGCLDFATALAVVCRRGELMGRAVDGGMVAVVGAGIARLPELLADAGLTDLDLANDNADDQVVLSGPHDSLAAASKLIRGAGVGRCVPLAVSAPFHSRYLRAAAREFEDHLDGVPFAEPRVPVISNVTARPHEPRLIRPLLAVQIHAPVRWRETVRYLADHGVRDLRELGPGRVLTGLWRPPTEAAQTDAAQAEAAQAPTDTAPVVEAGPECLGSAEFRADYGVQYAYLSGSMYRGIASVDLVARMGKAGLMGFFGAGGLDHDEVEDALRALARDPGPGRFGMNLLAMPDNPALESRLADLYVAHDVRFVEAAGFTAVTAPLVRFRFAGAHLDAAGRPVAVRHVVAKVSRPEVATAFMRPPPAALLDGLVAAGRLTAAEAAAAALLPVSGDVCAEADSAGHTDARVALALVPAMARLRDDLMAEHRYRTRIRVGAAGGLGTPDGVAAAFVLGADFVVTGSVNQCSPEAGTSSSVKDMLAAADVQDTAYAPAGDMFEIGARVQVLRRGTMFAARANKLFQLYQQYPSWEDIPEPVRRSVEERVFRRGFDEVWADTERRYRDTGRAAELARAAGNPRHRMALAFRWYFGRTTMAALRGDDDDRANFQVHTGPAIGCFNRFVRGTALEDWRVRHVDVIAEVLMRGAVEVLRRRAGALTPVPSAVTSSEQSRGLARD